MEMVVEAMRVNRITQKVCSKEIGGGPRTPMRTGRGQNENPPKAMPEKSEEKKEWM